MSSSELQGTKMAEQKNQKTIFNKLEGATFDEANQMFFDVNDFKTAEKELSKTYLRRDMKNGGIEKHPVNILSDRKSEQLKLEYETKMDIAQFRLEKLKIKEDMLLMKLNYHHEIYANDIAKNHKETNP